MKTQSPTFPNTQVFPEELGKKPKIKYATDFMIVLKSSVVMALSGSDKRLIMSGSRL